MFSIIHFLLSFSATCFFAVAQAQDGPGLRLTVPPNASTSTPVTVSWERLRQGGRRPEGFQLFLNRTESNSLAPGRLVFTSASLTDVQVDVPIPETGSYFFWTLNHNGPLEVQGKSEGQSVLFQVQAPPPVSPELPATAGPNPTPTPTTSSTSSPSAPSDLVQSGTSQASPSATSTGAENENENSTPVTFHVAIILGGIFGTIFLVILVLVLLYIVIYRPRRRQATQSENRRFHPTNVPPSFQGTTFIEQEKGDWTARQHRSMIGSILSDPRTSTTVAPFPFPGATISTPNGRRQNLPALGNPRLSQTSSLEYLSTAGVDTALLVPSAGRPTDRQLDIQESLRVLRTRLNEIEGDANASEVNRTEASAIRRRITVLESLLSSEWAADRTDDVPPGLV